MPERFFDKIPNNMAATVKLVMNIVVRNFMPDNIVFGRAVHAYYPEEPPQEM